MPPASPAPGWSSGLVCTESVATRRGVPARERRRAGTCNLPLVWSGGRGPKRPPVDSPSCNSARMSFMPGTDSSHSPDRRPLPGAGRTAVVTGASSGIGAATATRLAAEGFDVVIGARRVERLEALAGSTGARALPLDVTDEASVAEFAGALERVDVLVNNAGGSFDAAAVAEADLDSWARTYDVHGPGPVDEGAAPGVGSLGRRRRRLRGFDRGADLLRGRGVLHRGEARGAHAGRDAAARAERRAGAGRGDRTGNGAHRRVRAQPDGIAGKGRRR